MAPDLGTSRICAGEGRINGWSPEIDREVVLSESLTVKTRRKKEEKNIHQKKNLFPFFFFFFFFSNPKISLSLFLSLLPHFAFFSLKVPPPPSCRSRPFSHGLPLLPPAGIQVFISKFHFINFISFLFSNDKRWSGTARP